MHLTHASAVYNGTDKISQVIRRTGAAAVQIGCSLGQTANLSTSHLSMPMLQALLLGVPLHDAGSCLLVARSARPLKDRPLEHAGGSGSSPHSKLIHAAGEVPQLLAGSDVKNVEHHCSLFPGVAGVLAAVGDDVLFMRTVIYQADLVVAEPLDAAKGWATPKGNAPCVHCGDVAALGRPLDKAFSPETALVDLLQA